MIAPTKRRPLSIGMFTHWRFALNALPCCRLQWNYVRTTFNKFLVSKETVVLRRWERSKQKFGFIKRVDKGEITTVKDLES